MKKIFLFLLFFCCFFQISTGYADRLENRAFNAPASVSKSKHSLVSYLTQNIEDDHDKLRVIAYWIASHIA
ncbi:MAG: hypothetical protein J6Y91_01475 [Alphaproteobacteria bacterium]|nr:hypothetical protein [Alphaproteobacteria bacterium]